MKNIQPMQIVILISFIGVVAFIYFSQNIIDMLIASNTSVSDSQKVSKEVSDLIVSLDGITLDSQIFQNSFFRETTPIPQFPLSPLSGGGTFGKTNPFSGAYTVVATGTAGVVGGAVYSSQQSSSTPVIVNLPASRNTR